jgi:nucleotide-binding universal stress UspA family protein
MYKKIILGIDDSEDSLKAAEKTMELQKDFGSEVVIFSSVLHHISDLRPSFGVSPVPDGYLQYEVGRDRAKKANELLEDIKKKFNEKGLDVETRLIYDLGPQYYIEKQVKDEDFDLVVLGCKGEHSKLRRTIIGTIPEYTINHVDVDVLIAK